MAMGDDAACGGVLLAGDNATCSCCGGECGGERPELCGVAPRVVIRPSAFWGLRLRCGDGIEIESRSRSSGEATRRSAVVTRPSSRAARSRSWAGELGCTAPGALRCLRESTSARPRRVSRSAARSAAASMARSCSASRAAAAWPEREGGGEG